MQAKDIPDGALLAKLDALIRRGLLTGCACGCRGDFGLTEKGRLLLADLTGEAPDVVLQDAS